MHNSHADKTKDHEFWIQESLLPQKTEDVKNETKGKTNGGWLLLLVAIVVDMNIFTIGCSMVWTSPVLSRLFSNDTSENPLGIPITTTQESLIAGWFSLGFLLGPLLVPSTAKLLGSKHLITLTGIVQLISFAGLGYATNLYLYYVMRFNLGLCAGIGSVIVTVYISEITHKSNRGKYAAMIGGFAPLGQLYGYVVGPFFSVKIFSLLCVVPSLLYVPLSMLIVPDSPVHLVSKRNTVKALKTLKKLRNKDNVTEDLKEIQALVAEGQQEKVKFSMLKNRAIRMGFIIGFGFSILQALSGILVIMAFLGPIFDSAEIEIPGNYVAILVGITKVSTFVITSTLVEKAGRRPLLLVSTTFTSIALFLLGLFFYLKDHKFEFIHQISWLPVASVLLFIISYSLGIGAIIWVYTSEIFPINIKPLAISLSNIAFSIASTSATFAFPFMVKYLGIPVCFWAYSSVCAIGIVFVYFIAPETKGKSLAEIQDMLAHSKRY